MPCYWDHPHRGTPPSVRREMDDLTEMLCAMLRRHGPPDDRPDLHDWWKRHQEADRRRAEAEAEQLGHRERTGQLEANKAEGLAAFARLLASPAEGLTGAELDAWAEERALASRRLMGETDADYRARIVAYLGGGTKRGDDETV